MKGHPKACLCSSHSSAHPKRDTHAKKESVCSTRFSVLHLYQPAPSIPSPILTPKRSPYVVHALACLCSSHSYAHPKPGTNTNTH